MSIVNLNTEPGMISAAAVVGPSTDIIFYSTIPILDSSGAQGQLVELIPPMNTTVSSIQIFQCSLSLVTQVAVVDSQTNQLGTLEPDFTKAVSQWAPYTAVPQADLEDLSFPNVTGNLLINLVGDSISVSALAHFRLPVAKVVSIASPRRLLAGF